jgi:membrane protein
VNNDQLKLRWKNALSTEKYKKFIVSIDRHDLLILAGSIAYTTALALAPFLIIMLSAMALLDPEWQNSIVAEFSSLIGPQVQEAIQAVLENAQQKTTFRGIPGLVSFVVLMISASAIFSQLKTSLNKINEYSSKEKYSEIWLFTRDRIFSIGLVLGFIFLLITSLVVTTLLAALFKGRHGNVWEIVSFIIHLTVFSILFSSIFRFVPSQKLTWKHCFQSGVVATLFFLIGKALITFYLANSAISSAYGAAGSLVVLLIWLYYTSLTLLLSYEFVNTILLTHPNIPLDSQAVQN